VHPRAATQAVAPDLTSLSRWTLALPCVPWLRALPPREESSDAITCSSAPDLASLSRWAPMLPRGPGLTSPRVELRCCPRHAAGLARVQSTVACYRGACKACRQVATVRFNNATHAQLTTPGHGYSGDTTRQDGTTALTMFSIPG
jgi:hypothetical protein